MKKSIILLSACFALLCGCSDSQESSVKETPKETTTQTASATTALQDDSSESPTITTTNAPEAKSEKTCMEIAQAVSDKVGGDGAVMLAYQFASAEDGADFTSKGVKYEIYKYSPDSEKLNDADDGEISFNLGDLGSHTSKCKRYGNYVVLLSDSAAPDQSVLDEIKQAISPS